jgi:hypothetical protein
LLWKKAVKQLNSIHKRLARTTILLSQYIQHPEYKSLAPNGQPCKGDSHGLLKRYPVTALEFQRRYTTRYLTDGRRFDQVVIDEGTISSINGDSSIPFEESDIERIVVTHDRG